MGRVSSPPGRISSIRLIYSGQSIVNTKVRNVRPSCVHKCRNGFHDAVISFIGQMAQMNNNNIFVRVLRTVCFPKSRHYFRRKKDCISSQHIFKLGLYPAHRKSDICHLPRYTQKDSTLPCRQPRRQFAQHSFVSILFPVYRVNNLRQ